jgi:hypothetical protein
LNSEYEPQISNSGIKLWGLITLIFFLILFIITLIFILYYIAESQNSKINVINEWLLSDSKRIGLYFLSFLDCTLIIGMTQNILHVHYLNRAKIFDHLHLTLNMLQEANKNLLGAENIPSIMGENQKIDQFYFYNICDTFIDAGDSSES